MQKNKFLLVLILSTILFNTILFNYLSAQMPRTFAYQGVLANSSGAFIADGSHSLKVTLYDAISGGSAVFTETQNVLVIKGVFNMIIGSSAVIPSTMQFDRAYFLAVSVDGGAEMTPRTPMTAAPYAMYAAVAGQANSLAPGATGVVTSVNGLQGAVSLQGSGATTVTQSGNTITISSSGGGSGSGIQGVQSVDGSITVSNPNGPTATISVANNGVNSSKIADGSITAADIASGVIPTVPASLPPSGSAGGDLSGTYPNPTVANNAINSSKIADGSITAADIASGVIPTVPASLPPNGSAGGDLSGTYPNPSVTKIQGRTVANIAPTTGQVLGWNSTASNWEPQTPSSSSLTLPYTGTATVSGASAFSITNNSNSRNGAWAIRGEITNSNSNSAAIHGVNNSGDNSGYGVHGTGIIGVSGVTNSSLGSGVGVLGYAGGGSSIGVFGRTDGGSALYGQCLTGNTALTLDNGYIKVVGNTRAAFTHTVTGGNNYITSLSYPNQSNTDIVIVTPVWTGTYYTAPWGIYWAGSYWAIFSQNQTTPIPAGMKFNVLVIKQ